MYLKDSNSPQRETNCSPARCVSVDGRQRSWCSGSWHGSGLGEGGVLSCCSLLAVTLYKGKEVWGHSPEAVSLHHLQTCWGFFLFLPKRPLILEGKKFHTPHFRLLCIASIRQSLLRCCFIFLCLVLALVKGQAIFCLRISKWISQCISACYHMADKPLPSILKLSWLKHRLHPLHASGTSLFSKIYKTATWNNLFTFFSPKSCDP